MQPLLYMTKSRYPSAESMIYRGRFNSCISCIVNETVGDDYTLKMEIAAADELAGVVFPQMYVQETANPSDPPQFFEIYEVIPDNRTVRINAKHIKHCAQNNVIDSRSLALNMQQPLLTPQQHWDECILNAMFPTNFAFSSNIQTQKAMDAGYMKVATIGEFLEALQDTYNAELHYNNFSIELLTSRGVRRQLPLRWGNNLSAAEKTVSSEEIKSHVIGFARVKDRATGKEIEILGTTPYEIANHAAVTNKLEMVDASELLQDYEINTADGSDTGVDYVRNVCQVAASMHFKNNSAGQLKTNFTVDIRAQLDEMREYCIGDIVPVIFNDSVEGTAKIVSGEYDSLLERWNSLELGSVKAKLADYIVR